MGEMTSQETAWLALIGWAEGADYDTIVTGVDGPHTITDFSEHPFANGRPPIVVIAPGERPDFPDGLESTASGRYQFRWPTWKWLMASQLALRNLTDFTPATQDARCLAYLEAHGVTALIASGDIEPAILACGQLWGWASFPGSTAGQGGKTMDGLLEKYQQLLASEV
jgi:muramidase (phage lysozyme)